MAIAPGYVGTPMVKGMDQKTLSKILEQVTIGRLIEPAEVASLIGELTATRPSLVKPFSFTVAYVWGLKGSAPSQTKLSHHAPHQTPVHHTTWVITYFLRLSASIYYPPHYQSHFSS